MNKKEIEREIKSKLNIYSLVQYYPGWLIELEATSAWILDNFVEKEEVYHNIRGAELAWRDENIMLKHRIKELEEKNDKFKSENIYLSESKNSVDLGNRLRIHNLQEENKELTETKDFYKSEFKILKKKVKELVKENERLQKLIEEHNENLWDRLNTETPLEWLKRMAEKYPDVRKELSKVGDFCPLIGILNKLDYIYANSQCDGDIVQDFEQFFGGEEEIDKVLSELKEIEDECDHECCHHCSRCGE